MELLEIAKHEAKPFRVPRGLEGNWLDADTLVIAIPTSGSPE